MTASKAVLRIIDANLNRLGEGLRFLEEIARFVLDDEKLTTELKNLRHSLSIKDIQTKTAYLGARESSTDIGPAIKLTCEEPERNLSQSVVANARRAEESLRVLEDLAKTPESGLDCTALQDARFTVYTLEKELVSRLLRRDKIPLLSGLHAIVDTASLHLRTHAGAAREMLVGGAQVIQLRDKNTPKNRLLDIALELKELCLQHNALLIVNDALDIALACDADGLHVGQGDLPVKVARRLLPVDKLIGCSVRSISEARKACEDGADYLGYGAVFPTATKPGSRALGCELLAQIKKEVDLPLIAIGGINKGNVAEVLRSGADGVAVISALLSADSVEKATRNIINTLEANREQTQ